MIVVADTTPLNYLILIGEIDLLPLLFGQVLLPGAAFEELQREATPARVREWMSSKPNWLAIRAVTTHINPLLSNLDAGEREAIQLALDLNIRTVLIDEVEGRQIAQALHLQVRGTLGILERAAQLGKVDLRSAIGKLQQTNFFSRPPYLPHFSSATHNITRQAHHVQRIPHQNVVRPLSRAPQQSL